MLKFELNDLYFHLKEKLLSFLKLDAAELGLHVMWILRSLLQIASHPNTYEPQYNSFDNHAFNVSEIWTQEGEIGWTVREGGRETGGTRSQVIPHFGLSVPECLFLLLK